MLSPSRWLLTSSTRSLFFLLQLRQPRHRRAIHLRLHSFLLGPGCSVITPYRQSQRSLRDIQKQSLTRDSLFHHQTVYFHITTAFPRAAEYFYSPYIHTHTHTHIITSNLTWTHLPRESSRLCSQQTRPSVPVPSIVTPGRNVESTEPHTRPPVNSNPQDISPYSTFLLTCQSPTQAKIAPANFTRARLPIRII